MSVPLLFIHGAGLTGDVWAEQHGAFPGAHAPSLPGRGPAGAPAQVGAFVDFVHECVLGLGGRVITVGSSLGGAIAISHALDHPQQVAATVVIGSGARLAVAPHVLAGLRDDFSGTVGKLSAWMFGAPSARLQAFAVEQMQRVGPDQTRRDFAACNAYDVRARLAELRVPLLAITGTNDVMTPPKYGTYLRDHAPGASFIEIPGAGHLAMLEASAPVNAAIAAFIARLP